MLGGDPPARSRRDEEFIIANFWYNDYGTGQADVNYIANVGYKGKTAAFPKEMPAAFPKEMQHVLNANGGRNFI